MEQNDFLHQGWFTPTSPLLTLSIPVSHIPRIGKKDIEEKGYQKKHQHEWTHEDWQEYLEDEQKHLDDISRR